MAIIDELAYFAFQENFSPFPLTKLINGMEYDLLINIFPFHKRYKFN